MDICHGNYMHYKHVLAKLWLVKLTLSKCTLKLLAFMCKNWTGSFACVHLWVHLSLYVGHEDVHSCLLSILLCVYVLHSTTYILAKHGTIWSVVFVILVLGIISCRLPTWLVSNKVLGCRHAWHSTILMLHLRASSMHWIWSQTMVCIPTAPSMTINKRIPICN